MPTTVGAFTVGTARHSRRGGGRADPGGVYEECTEIYTALLAAGTLGTLSAFTGLPSARAQHPTLTTLYVKGYNFDCVTDNKTGNDVWEISVDYGRSEAVVSDGEYGTSKVTARGGGTSETAVDLVSDAETGVPVINAAGDPFDTVPQRTLEAPMVEFTRLESVHPAAKSLLSGTVNSSAVTVMGVAFAARTAKIKITWRDTLSSETLHYEVTYRVEGRNLWVKIDGANTNIGWDEAFVQAGLHYLESGVRVRFMEAGEDGKERPSGNPCLISAAGADNRTGDPVVKRVAANKGNAWTALRLPSS